MQLILERSETTTTNDVLEGQTSHNTVLVHFTAREGGACSKCSAPQCALHFEQAALLALVRLELFTWLLILHWQNMLVTAGQVATMHSNHSAPNWLRHPTRMVYCCTLRQDSPRDYLQLQALT